MYCLFCFKVTDQIKYSINESLITLDIRQWIWYWSQISLLNVSSASSYIHPNKPVYLSNICFCKPVRAATVFPSKAFWTINVCASKPVCPSNAYYSKRICPSNDCQSKPVSPINACLQNPPFVIKLLFLNFLLVILSF